MRIFSKIYIVSHSTERADKTCLNCNAQLHGRYCHVCGQENIEPRESFWAIVSHFFSDFTHFDGKFFKTAGTLIMRPGFLPLEYMNGKRARYLHPIRMYLFTSFIFFLIFYSISRPVVSPERRAPASALDLELGDVLFKPRDTLATFSLSGREYSSVAEYDSIQKTLPRQERDGWFSSKMIRSNIERRNTYSGRGDAMTQSVMNNFMHSFPYLLFVSLPICAFFLKLLYIRDKNQLYSGHAIFLVYLYIFNFICLLISFGFDKVNSAFHLGWVRYLKFALFLYIGVYTLIAFKVYYAQGWGKTLFKFIAWNILAFITILALFVIFFLFSLMKV